MRALTRFVLALAIGSASASAQVPDLPRLAVETLPETTRPQIEEAYQRAVQRPRDPAAAGELGMLLHAFNQYESAEAAYARAHALDPRDFQWAYALGIVRSLLGKHEAAIAALDEAVRLDAAYLPARVRLAEALVDLGNLERAAAAYATLAREHPELAAVQYGLGKINAAAGDRAQAITHYVRACDLFPEFGAAHYALALAYRDAGETAKAQEQLALYQKYKLRWPPLDDPALDRVKQRGTAASHHLTEGVQLGAENRIAQAIVEHERALALDPTFVQAEVNLVSLYGQTGEWDKAEKHYLAAMAINPNLADVHYNYGVLLAKQGRTREAADAFQRALQIDPFHPPAHNNLGQMLELDARVAEAAEQYRQAIHNDPTYREARFNLGRMLVAEKRNAEAIDEFLKILTPADDQTPRYMFALAAAYVRAGEIEKGVQFATEARERATALGQSDLAATIDRDLRQLETSRPRK